MKKEQIRKETKSEKLYKIMTSGKTTGEIEAQLSKLVPVEWLDDEYDNINNELLMARIYTEESLNLIDRMMKKLEVK